MMQCISLHIKYIEKKNKELRLMLEEAVCKKRIMSEIRPYKHLKIVTLCEDPSPFPHCALNSVPTQEKRPFAGI